MTKDDTKKAIEIMQAYVDGKTIQVYDEDHSTWVDSIGPAWHWGFSSYRVKPEPLECWVRVLNDRKCSTCHDSQEDAAFTNGYSDNWTVRKFREVIE